MSIIEKIRQSLETKRHPKATLPELRDWQLLFEKQRGAENRNDVMRVFIDFIIDRRHTDVMIPGYCIAEGEVYGHESIADGERIFTSYIKRIFTIDKRTMVCHNRTFDDENVFLVGIETIDGGKYWVDYLKKNEFMDKLEFDFVINRKLSDESGYYASPHCTRCGFL